MTDPTTQQDPQPDPTATPTTAPAAPAAAPVATSTAAPAAPAAAPTAPVQASHDASTGVVTYEPTGDVGLDLSLEYFGKLGLALDSPEMQEAGKGNFSYLEAKLAAMGDKAAGADKYLSLAKDAYGRLEESSKAAVAERRKAVHEAVGGEETWKQVQEYVNTNADPEELEAVKDAIGQGGIVARAMATFLHQQYLAATGTTVNPPNPVTGNPSAPVGGAPLTRAGYRQEVNELVKRIGSHRMDSSPEYAALRAKYANVTQ